MNVTKTIKYTKFKIRVYNTIKNEVEVININRISSIKLKQLKEDLSRDGFDFLKLIGEEHYSIKYSMEINKFIENSEVVEIKEKGE